MYQALYRVWRSQRFSDLVGQTAIAQTLKNAIVQRQTSHAYLFTGPRGTGKTSAAKIFAKAINCHHSQGGEPCNQCETCKSITEGRLNDVIEIDAASNNGVDEIREIRDKVKYAATQADYKVYIIDEVHMLSTGAFNALLKTLEEPPAGVVFILATTEPHKIPATIISRTQRFDFKRISDRDIENHLAFILTQLKVDFEPEALAVIARVAEGGMRDALSMLDQTLSFGSGTVRLADALTVTGSVSNDLLMNYLQACLNHEAEHALEILTKIISNGQTSSRFLEDVLLFCRDILLQKEAPSLVKNQSLLHTEGFIDLANQLTKEKIYQYIQLINTTQQEMKQTSHHEIYLEMVTIQLATEASMGPSTTDAPAKEVHSSLQVEIQELTDKIQQLEDKIKQLSSQSATNEPRNTPKTANHTPLKTSYRLPTERVYQVLAKATRERLIQVKENWEDVLQLLSVTQRAVLKASEPVAASDQGVVLAFDYEILCKRASEDEELLNKLAEAFQRVLPIVPEPVCIPKESWHHLRQDFLKMKPNENQREIDKTAIESSDLAPTETKIQEAVEQAKSLFGEENITIIND